MKNWYYVQAIARIYEAPFTIIHSPGKAGALFSLELGEIVSRDIEQAELIVRGREDTCPKIEEPELLPYFSGCCSGRIRTQAGSNGKYIYS